MLFRSQGPSIRILVDSSGLPIGILWFLRSTRSSWRSPSGLTDGIALEEPSVEPEFNSSSQAERHGHCSKQRIFDISPRFVLLFSKNHGFLGGTGAGLGSGLGQPRPAANFLVPLILSISDLSVMTISGYLLPYASVQVQRL